MEKLSTYLEGQSKAQFARQIGVTASYLSNLLSGYKSPSFTLARRIKEETNGEVTFEDWK